MKRVAVVVIAMLLILLPFELASARGRGGGFGVPRSSGGMPGGSSKSVRDRKSRKDSAQHRERIRIENGDSMRDEEIGNRSR